MKSTMLLSAILIAPVGALAQPDASVLATCVKAESTSRPARYTPIPAGQLFVTEDDTAQRTETTIRHGQETIGIWTTSSPHRFGLLYNGNSIPADRIERLSSAKPSAFAPQLAMWGIVDAGARSYACITFNFDGLGQSGSFQTVRGMYLIERKKRRARSYYAIGRVTGAGAAPIK